MSIKVKEITVNQNLDRESFPMIMSDPYGLGQQIILVTRYHPETCTYEGTNINGVGNSIGYYSKGWESKFTPWYGTLEISNSKD
jgi:hypothetical protein